MITDEDEEVVSFNLQLDEEYTFEDRDQHMRFCPPEEVVIVEDREEFNPDQPNVYQELAEKDHYLMLAAEAGKVLLEKNQELEDQFQRLQEEYLQKVEALEQERHHLKRELQDRDYDYESRMQDLQHELTHLSGQLQTVQKTTRTTEQSNKNNLDDIQIQNSSLLKELDVVKSYNQELAQQVQTLSKRIDGRLTANNNNSNHSSRKSSSVMFPDYDDQNGRRGSNDPESLVDYEEMRNLKSKVQKLAEEKEGLETSLHVVAHEKDVIFSDHKNTVGKILLLETEILSLKQQIGICQEDLNKTKKKNVKLKDQLEEYVLTQSQNMGKRDSRDNSLFNELEMSLSEVDRNMQSMSTPKKNSDDEDYDDELPGVFITTPNRAEMEKMSAELKAVFLKLKVLKNKLTDENSEDDDSDTENLITTDMISRMVDQVIHLIQERILSLGVIDPRMESPRGRGGSEIEEDNISLPESRMSDSEVELLEQKVVELNQRLNMKTSECDKAQKQLQLVQAAAVKNQETVEELTVTTNKQEREIDALRKEREILLADTTMEEKLKQVLQERDEALMKANELTARQEQANSDMQKLNNQLILAVQQKVELGEQLEAWQNDMASLIHQQLSTQIKKEQKTSRKRTSTASNNTGKSMLAKLFPSKAKSPVPPPAKSPVPK